MYRKLLEDHFKCSHIKKFTANYHRVSQDVKNFFQAFCEVFIALHWICFVLNSFCFCKIFMHWCIYNTHECDEIKYYWCEHFCTLHRKQSVVVIVLRCSNTIFSYFLLQAWFSSAHKGVTMMISQCRCEYVHVSILSLRKVINGKDEIEVSFFQAPLSTFM